MLFSAAEQHHFFVTGDAIVYTLCADAQLTPLGLEEEHK